MTYYTNNMGGLQHFNRKWNIVANISMKYLICKSCDCHKKQ